MATGGHDPSEGVMPVFIKTFEVPDGRENPPSVYDMCCAAEATSGDGSILGAQIHRGLWRIYPKNNDARQILLVRGIQIRDVLIQPKNTNPYQLYQDRPFGLEKPTTKLWIDNIPLSCANEEIENTLKQIGCELRSKIVEERARNHERKLTHFLTGRRYVIITTPDEPLGQHVEVAGLFTATLYHKEMKEKTKKIPICSKCLQEGHHQSVCQNDIVCKACKNPGHKRGDPQCKRLLLDLQQEFIENVENENQTQPQQNQQNSTQGGAKPRSVSTSSRSRHLNRSKTTEERQRSSTPSKRSRTNSGNSPASQTAAKLQKSNDSVRASHAFTIESWANKDSQTKEQNKEQIQVNPNSEMNIS